MFGHHFFGQHFWSNRYWGDGGDVAPPQVPAGAFRFGTGGGGVGLDAAGQITPLIDLPGGLTVTVDGELVFMT